MANVRPREVKTFGKLRQGITPMIPGQPERIPFVWYDTVTIISGTTTTLDAFNTVQADKVLGNMEAAGQIPAPQYFDIVHIGVRPELAPQATGLSASPTNAGSQNDMETIIKGTAELIIAQKSYWRGPIHLAPSGSGVWGGAAIGFTGAATDGERQDWSTNGRPDLRNRNNWWGDITIPHNQNFVLRLAWSTAVTLAAGNTTLNCYLEGYLYRRVL